MPPPFFLIGPSSPTLTPAKVVDVWIRTSISAYLIEFSVNNKNIPDSSIRDMLIPKCKSRGTQTDRYALSSSCQRTTIVPASQGHQRRQAVSVHHATDPTGHRRPPHLPRPVGLVAAESALVSHADAPSGQGAPPSLVPDVPVSQYSPAPADARRATDPRRSVQHRLAHRRPAGGAWPGVGSADWSRQ